MKSYVGKEGFHRINYLHQIGKALMNDETNDSLAFISTYYTNLGINVAKKGVLRIDSNIKREICKGCHGVLIPGITAMVRKRRKPRGHVNWKCTKCGTRRIYNTRENCQIWTERNEAVVEIVN